MLVFNNKTLLLLEHQQLKNRSNSKVREHAFFVGVKREYFHR
jgi:hypothetical protein